MELLDDMSALEPRFTRAKVATPSASSLTALLAMAGSSDAHSPARRRSVRLGQRALERGLVDVDFSSVFSNRKMAQITAHLAADILNAPVEQIDISNLSEEQVEAALVQICSAICSDESYDVAALHRLNDLLPEHVQIHVGENTGIVNVIVRERMARVEASVPAERRQVDRIAAPSTPDQVRAPPETPAAPRRPPASRTRGYSGGFAPHQPLPVAHVPTPRAYGLPSPPQEVARFPPYPTISPIAVNLFPGLEDDDMDTA